MSSAHHTPGPWAVRFFGMTKDEVAVVSTVKVDDPFDGGTYEPIVADLYRGGSGNLHDARLIAQAPNMLKALKLCRFDSLNMSLGDWEFIKDTIAAAEGNA